MLQELFWVHFLGACTIQTVPKYIWMQHCPLISTHIILFQDTVTKASKILFQLKQYS